MRGLTVEVFIMFSAAALSGYIDSNPRNLFLCYHDKETASSSVYLILRQLLWLHRFSRIYTPFNSSLTYDLLRRPLTRLIIWMALLNSSKWLRKNRKINQWFLFLPPPFSTSFKKQIFFLLILQFIINTKAMTLYLTKIASNNYRNNFD